jgi:hypothetical protein
MGRPDVQSDPIRPDGFGSEECSVEDQMRSKTDQRAILLAQWFALSTVDHHGGRAARLARDGSPLSSHGEPRAAATEKAARLENRNRLLSSGAAR